MSGRKLERLLETLKSRLENEPALHDRLTGGIYIPIFEGGICGNIEIKVMNLQPRKHEVENN